MNIRFIGGIAIAAVLSTTLVGYRLGAGAWPTFKRVASSPPLMATTAAVERKVLYWKDPDAGTEFSATPKRTATGRDYVPVYDDQEPDLPGAAPNPVAATGGSRKILYYRNPMGLPDTSPVPKKDWMGMDYIAVREGEDDGGATVKVSLDKVQRSGVRTAPVEVRRISRPIRAPGVAKIDERTLRTVALRADGFIEKLYVSENGRHVKAGEPLFRVFIPLLARAQVEVRGPAASTASSFSEGGADATQRLRNLGLSEDAIRQVRNNPKLTGSIDWPSPASGVIVKKAVVEGMQMKAGEEIFRIADLSTMWIIADVAEQDIGQVKIGATATITLRAYPGETFAGAVTFVLHELEMATRTAKVRIEVANPDHRIKHEMFADVEINAGADEPERLVVPVSALIDSGNRQVVLIDRGEGRFEPRAVKIGVRGESVVEITEGVKVGEQVVTSATFLIDAESNLKAALSSFSAEPAMQAEGQK